ncbi:hypothetical protein Rt10032_c09g3760 [Rhodotorula toruloides]|uniref:Uncharacterized protein n=1 Tax=Rhodotorula toruloides TaxID=5286 RepID=A0A511KH93_RHOTO|nr:hypothetical protein Rt10032_c09g3760 [Rhodotorula toruloides]
MPTNSGPFTSSNVRHTVRQLDTADPLINTILPILNGTAIDTSDGLMRFVYGLDVGFGRVHSLVGSLSALPIMKGTSSYAWTLWVSAILSAFLTVGLTLLERTFPACAHIPTG